MTIQQFLNGIIYVGSVLGAITVIGVFGHFAFVRPLRLFLRAEIVDTLVGIRKDLKALDTRLHDHIENDEHPRRIRA